MSKSPWGNIGAWAAETERAEQEEREEAAKAAAEAAARALAAPPPSSGGGGGGGDNYPSLRDSLSTAKQNKKKTKMTLLEFSMQGSGSYGIQSQRLTTEEMMRLPTGPKERAPGDEMQYGNNRIGGGFSNYGNRYGGSQTGRIRDRGDGGDGGDGSWGGSRKSYGGFEDDRRRGPSMNRGQDYDQTSRADEVDNWASMKKPLPSFNSGNGSQGRPSRYASLGGGGGGASRADEVDNWAATKKPIPSPASRSSTFGSSFRDSRPEPERWTRDGNQERQRLVLDLPEGEVAPKVNKPNPFGAARPREEVLAEKGLDWKKLDSEIDAKKAVSRPTSSHSSRPGSSQSARSESQVLQGTLEGTAKAKPKVNPFGDAKPREILLQEKGVDWRKIDLDLELRRVERPETEEEKKLKEEIELLKNSSEDKSILSDEICKKEKDLEVLVRELDDKIRFGQKPTERPGSGGGRFAGVTDRPPSQSGRYEEPRGGEFRERPRSRGTGDAWSRPMDDRRAYQGGRGRGGYLGSRDMDRSSSRERW